MPALRAARELKQQVTANRLYGDIEKVVTAVREVLDGLSPAAALKLAA